ncbi:MAG: cation transporter dimerization domain-containing protein [Ignisphaera sp.]
MYSERSSTTAFIIVSMLSAFGGLLKVYGGVVGGSKSVFVDALTSIANTVSVLAIYKFFRESLKPPDTDHSYGHARYALGGAIFTVSLYSFVAGVIAIDLYESIASRYVVTVSSSVYAAMALIPYTLAILFTRRFGSLSILYARFTSIEFIESGVAIATSFMGATISYMIDFAGAVALTSYLFVEIAKSLKEIIYAVSDHTPRDVIEIVRSTLLRYGISDVGEIRIRRVFEDSFHGDATIRLPPETTIDKAHEIVDKVENELREKHNIDIVIHVEPKKLETLEKGPKLGYTQSSDSQ